jgi:hypothetical protein
MNCAISTLRLPQIYMLSFGTPQVLRPMTILVVVAEQPRRVACETTDAKKTFELSVSSDLGKVLVDQRCEVRVLSPNVLALRG